MKDKNIQINIEKQNGVSKKKGFPKNYFFYFKFSKVLEKLKYQNLLKKFHKKNRLINNNSIKNYLIQKLSLKDIEKSLNTSKLFSNLKAKSLNSQDK